MTVKAKHDSMLVDNRLRRIENRLRRIEILFMKTMHSDKKIKKEFDVLEKEEKNIEKEQKVLEKEEEKILQEMKHLEAEEEWHIEVQYNCRSKVMNDNNTIGCQKIGKLCDMTVCPLWKENKK